MSEEEEPCAFHLPDGAMLACVVCGGARFFTRRSRLPSGTKGLPAQCALCSACGFVHWFADERHPQEADEG